MNLRVCCEGEFYPVVDNLTLGRHLDNDIVVAGEDVLDYHLRFEPGDRGLTVHPLGDATFTIAERVSNQPTGVIPGDVVQVGQVRVQVEVVENNDSESIEWCLYASSDDTVCKLLPLTRIGRDDSAELQLVDDHISREHALIVVNQGVWVQDLGSANGTYVNGDRIVGGAFVFHGDHIAFDTVGFQLVGKNADLTPIRKQDTPGSTPIIAKPVEVLPDTTEINIVDTSQFATVDISPGTETGAFFVGASDPVSGNTYKARMGRILIGRDESCEIALPDQTVSARHAEVMLRSDGCTISNLMATNGTRVNGKEIDTMPLVDGDVLRLGRVSLVFKDVPVNQYDRSLLRRAQWVFIGASIVLALLLASVLW